MAGTDGRRTGTGTDGRDRWQADRDRDRWQGPMAGTDGRDRWQADRWQGRTKTFQKIYIHLLHAIGRKYILLAWKGPTNLAARDRPGPTGTDRPGPTDRDRPTGTDRPGPTDRDRPTGRGSTSTKARAPAPKR